ncbi:hypothetical protein [Streptomyces sp. NBC_01538]|uniref:hypothetical protein n=1 Tax=Streptomyces sp. NBC_01538 TaxID=2903897 RepID=UPI00386F35AD
MINTVLPHQWMSMRTGRRTKDTREYKWPWLDARSPSAAAATKPSHEPATSADTPFRASHDQDCGCRVRRQPKRGD